MNCPNYKEILKNNLFPFSYNFMLEEWIFQGDNHPKHMPKLVKWPAQSPDHNPIENLWKELGYRIEGPNHLNCADFLQHLQGEWAKILSDLLEKLSQCHSVVKTLSQPKWWRLNIEVNHGTFYSYLLNIHCKQDVFLH